MKWFEQMEHYDVEQVVACQDKASGLKAFIVIHDTTLGPALGGTRMWPYATEEEALEDALRLSRGMTYKNAAAGLNLGGGKAVIIGDPKSDKSEALFRAFGRYVESLGGRYITAEDVGTKEEDMDYIKLETNFVTGTSSVNGAGDPSPVTAFGVYRGMKAAAEEAFGTPSLKGKTVAVQGVGQVAFRLCEHLHEEGAKLIVTDIDDQAVQRACDTFGAEAVEPDAIYDVEADIFAPCALGAVLNDETIPRLKVRAVAGSANNQLKESRHGFALKERGIVYAPDYVINSGGVINVADDMIGYNKERALRRVSKIYDVLGDIFEIARSRHIPSHLAADQLAEERIQQVGASRTQFLRRSKSVLDLIDR